MGRLAMRSDAFCLVLVFALGAGRGEKMAPMTMSTTTPNSPIINTRLIVLNRLRRFVVSTTEAMRLLPTVEQPAPFLKCKMAFHARGYSARAWSDCACVRAPRQVCMGDELDGDLRR